MPLPHLAAELWQQILDEAVSLPTFLSVDSLSEIANPLYDAYEPDETSIPHISNLSNLFKRSKTNNLTGIVSNSRNRIDEDYNDPDRIYWKMERQRNDLQRVCKSWDTYLRRFEHRYVTITDVIHGIVPERALSTATRIGHGVCVSDNPFCCLDKRSVSHYSSIIAGLGEEGLSVEILDASGPCGWVVPELLIEMHQYMPHLKAVICAYIKHPFYNIWTQVIGCLPSLVFVSFTECTDYNFSSRPPSVYRNSTITTMSCVTTDYDPFTLSLYTDDIPSLRDLRFPRIAQGSATSLTKLLRNIGRNLTSLQLGRHKPSSQVLPQEVWELCPQLKRLDCSFSICYSPPPNHPLHTLSFSMPALRGTTIIKVSRPFQSAIRDWSSLRRLILQGRWDQCTDMEALGLFCWAHDLFRECTECGVVLEDITGRSFQDSGFENVALD